MTMHTRHWEQRDSSTASRGPGLAAGWGALLCVGLLVAGCTGSTTDGNDDGVNETGTAPVTGAPTGTGTGLIPPDTSGGGGQASTSREPASPAGPPEAATLAWLRGPTPHDGILIGDPGLQRWQGPVGGESAILGDGWYRYFGADGSMVGCTSSGSCVGVGGDGTVAVTGGPTEPRDVYRANGEFVGRYTAGGDQLSTTPRWDTLAEALTGSGVDVAGLVNAATLAAPFAGGVTGDPHVVTAGGLRATTQVAGQFVGRGGDDGHRIQVQFSPMPHRDDVSIVSAVAIGTGSDVVVIETDGTVTLNGRTLQRSPEFSQMSLAGGVALGRWPADASGVSTAAVVWPDGGSVVATANPALGITLVAHLYAVDGASGILGSRPAGPTTDLLARGRTPSTAQAAITSWRVDSGERLFVSPDATDDDFPLSAATIGPDATETAHKLCSGHGMSQAADIQACTFDVALTGDTGFIAGHVALATAAESGHIPDSFAAQWPALVVGSMAAAPELPAGGIVDVALTSGARRTYAVSLDRAGRVTFVNREGCPADANPPGMNAAAMRLFDAAGNAVSDRIAICGHGETPELSAGAYRLVLANGLHQEVVPVHVDVTVP